MEFVSHLQYAVLMIPALFIAMIVHELGHGYTAYKLGDNTPKVAGRLTVNPFPHLDMFGSILFPAILIIAKAPFVFGWAKPIPINPLNFKKIDYRKGMALTALMGPLSNIITAVIFSILFHLSLTLFQQLPPSIAKTVLLPLTLFFHLTVSINIIIAIFNLLPIPSFDGWRVILSFLPLHLERKLENLDFYGIFIVLALFILGIIHILILPPYIFIMSLLNMPLNIQF